MLEALEDIKVGNLARHYIRDYAVMELLGKGAFGNVYQVKKDNGETLYAMKQLPLDAVDMEATTSGGGGQNGNHRGGGGGGGGNDAGEASSHLKREVDILTVLQHPNIVHYYESFKFNEALYIVMELVEGATLLDHLNSLTEKSQSMPESRIWSFFTQMCLALRYIHKEKQVVHRDLTPSNIMITADGIIKLADFGLARMRMGTNSVMDSVVGTVLYQCPEIIQHEQYGEKADVWSLGCILYQMAMLRPPFGGGNPLIVATAIVEGKYPPLNADAYPPTSLLAMAVSRMLTPEPAQRPDIDEVASLISPILLSELGRVSKAEHTLRAEVMMEREWRQKQEKDAAKNKEAVHRLFARHNSEVPPSQNPASGNATSTTTTSTANPATAAAAVAAAASGAPAPLSVDVVGRLPSREALDGGANALRRSLPSRSPMLSISSSRIREIHDPMTRILNQLHKILFISQLPPSMEGELSYERALIERYKRELFSHRNHYRGRSLKDELHKLMNGSQEMIDLSFRAPAADISDVHTNNGLPFGQRQPRLSYEDLQKHIEQVLEVTGYYALHEMACDAPAPEAPVIERTNSMPDRLSSSKPKTLPPVRTTPRGGAERAAAPM